MVPKKQLLVLTLSIVVTVSVACGTDSTTVAAEPTSIALPTHTSVPEPENIISRSVATDLALKKIREGWDMTTGGPGPAADIRDVTVRFMSMVEFELIHDAAISGWFSGPGYGANNHVWVVQARADSMLVRKNAPGGNVAFRYAIEAINATTGRFSASARTVAEPYFISAEINHSGMPGSESLADPATPTNISREQARQIVEDNYSGYKSSLIDRMEIELVDAPGGGNIWWVYTPRELGSNCGGSGGPGSNGRFLWCFATAGWLFVDAETGTIYDGKNFGRSSLMITNAERQALHRFAWAEGWWELWHQLKPYEEDRILPAGLAESLDRPNAPTPTPGPPTPTPDPGLPPRATPTPAPTPFPATTP